MKTTVSVPATSANIGPGFDILGLSIDELTDTLEVFWGQDADLAQPVKVIGGGLFAELGDKVDETPQNLVYRLICEELALLGVDKDLPLSIVCYNNIAHSRGLGSSSAAIVSALRAAFRIASSLLAGISQKLVLDGVEMGEDEYVYARGCAIEGHPDNVAPCVYGGIEMAYGDSYALRSITPADNLNLALQIFCDSSLKTSDARAVIPEKIPHIDAIKNTRSFGCLLSGLQIGSNELLLEANDYLHQEYRRSLYPKSMELVDIGMNNGIPTFISGAGTSVISLMFGKSDEFSEIFSKTFTNCQKSNDYSNIYIVK